jgi:Reverse transcriptase (RNA-dependent DNA polymerase)
MLAAAELAKSTSYKEAIEGPEQKHWREAMDEENAALQKNHTWVLIDLPLGYKAIANKWVYKKKLNANGSIYYKVRLVIKGYEQCMSIDYEETYAPVTILKTVRVLLALAACFGWHAHHMDVKTAFLNPDLSHEVYMLQPKGYEWGNWVCLLLKALYGLKQASQEWYIDINKFLRNIGFTNAITDANLYLAQSLLFLLFVNDMLIFTSTTNALKELKYQLTSQYEMTDLGEVRQFLGLQIY